MKALSRTAPHIRHMRYAAASKARGSRVVNGGIHGMRAATAGGGSGSSLSFMACNSSVQFCTRPAIAGAALRRVASKGFRSCVVLTAPLDRWLVEHQQPRGRVYPRALGS
jgi:hypothetical protein